MPKAKTTSARQARPQATSARQPKPKPRQPITKRTPRKAMKKAAADKPGKGKVSASSAALSEQSQVLLEGLVPTWRSQYKAERLELIRSKTQEWWREYVHTHLRGQVRFLVIAEAPPWRREGEPTYVFKPNDGDYDGGILGALVGGISAAESDASAPVFTKKNADSKAAALRYLGSRGVLLVDPLPFSLYYSGKGDGCKHSNLREKVAYTAAARAGWEEVLTQLDDVGVDIATDVVIGFTLLKSARALTIGDDQGPRPLKLPGGREVVIEPRAATFTTSAGYPDAKVLTKMLTTRTPLSRV